MSEVPGNEKENTVTENSEEAKKKPDLQDTISRLLRKKKEVNSQEGEGLAK
ncbi:MAG: hypothetical protein JKY86_13735 [Gammaproteobacteria bacterium]|nr:hypothetical protein [Gammaproteobacteria bacterium]MBL4890658.1 hypothetical protein [Rhizobiaceae bacterium]